WTSTRGCRAPSPARARPPFCGTTSPASPPTTRSRTRSPRRAAGRDIRRWRADRLGHAAGCVGTVLHTDRCRCAPQRPGAARRSVDRPAVLVGDPGGAEEVAAQLITPLLGGALLLAQQLRHPGVQVGGDPPLQLLPARAQREHPLAAVGPRVVDVLDDALPAVQ